MECPLLGVKRTCRFALQMSAYDPKRTCFDSDGIGLTTSDAMGRPTKGSGKLVSAFGESSHERTLIFDQ